MRYFVYKDSEILGPFSAEDLDRAGVLRSDTLVCEESSSGRRDGDWRALGDVSELAQTAVEAPPLTVEEPLSAASAGVLERMELDSVGVPAESDPEASRDWLDELFGAKDLQTRWLGGEDEGAAELRTAKGVIDELTTRVAELQQRVKELEAVAKSYEDGRVRFNVTKAAAEEKPRPKFGAAKPLKVVRKGEAASAPAAPASAPPQIQPAQAASAPLPPAPAPTPAAMPGLPPLPTLAPAPEAASAPPVALFAPAPSPATAPMPAAPTVPPSPGLSLPPASLGVPPPSGLAAVSLQPPSEQALPPAPATLQAAPLPAPALEAPPMTMAFGGATPAAAPPVPTLGAPPQTPAATGFGAAPFGAPATNVFSSGSLPAAPPPPTSPPTMPPLTGPQPAGAQTQDVLARLAKPAEPKTAPPKQRPLPSTKAIVSLAVAVVLLVAAAFAMFLRNSRDLKSMVAMGSDQKPMGTEVPEEARPAAAAAAAPAQPVAAQAGATAAPMGAAAPPTQVAQPAPMAGAAPAGPAPADADAGAAAIAMVKDFPLDGDRGTVGGWLQYSFTANPDEGNQEQWTAGAVDATTYLVQYRVTPGQHSSAKEPISYVFEADVSRKTVLGKNPPARELLSGTAPKAAPARKRKAGARKKRRVKPAPVKHHEVPLLPLPSDAELLPPAADDSNFQNDTVHPGL